MRIAANLGVKDEVELVERTIAHLRAIGVDHINAFDACSTDGTTELLRKHESEEGFWFIQINNQEPDGLEKIWLHKNLELAKRSEADWVIFLDADEYWIPATGSLRDCAVLADSDLLSVDRYNVPMGPTGLLMPDELTPSNYEELLLYVEPIPNFRPYLEAHPETPWVRGVPMPKIMARPSRIGVLTHGMHDVVAAGHEPLQRSRPCDLLIAHLPFTTPARFKRKIDNVRQVFSVHDKYFAGQMAWHWRRWVAAADQGRLDEEFQRQAASAEALADLRRKGVIQSAAEVFQNRKAPAW
jgi:glycosyltransferase involved in cell wall biosynthesis